jgi:hypothetical protein
VILAAVGIDSLSQYLVPGNKPGGKANRLFFTCIAPVLCRVLAMDFREHAFF